MKLVTVNDKISIEELKTMSETMAGKLVKAVVDIEKEVMAVDAAMHADEEAFLLDEGSQQEFLWGINLHPTRDGESFIEFDSMINIRPSQGNRTKGVDDPLIQKIVNPMIKR